MSRSKKSTKSSGITLARRSLREVLFESDSTYLLKLVVYILVATLWLRLGTPLALGAFVVQALPVGTLGSLLCIRMLERHQLDRKIMYAAVLTVGIITSFLPAGIHI